MPSRREVYLHSIKYPGHIATVDEEDYEAVSQYRWSPFIHRGKVYVQTNINRRTVYMHQLIMGTVGMGKGVAVDHLDHDGLNNTRSNLRVTTCANNVRRHRSVSRVSTSGYTGVSWRDHRRERGWEAYIYVSKRKVRLGVFPTARAAALVRDMASIELHGRENTYLNFPESRSGGAW